MEDKEKERESVASRLRRPGNVRGLLPGLPERGKIKIGMKGPTITSRSSGKEFQPPVKLDHFVITTLERGPDGNYKRDEEMHKKIGDKPTLIKGRLLFNDIDLNFQSRYASFRGRTLWCGGDGQFAMRQDDRDPSKRNQVDCPCPRIEQGYKGTDKCKVNGVLSYVIDGAVGVGGVYKFRTTSWNSVQGILSSLALIHSLTGGQLAGIPLDMVLRQKAVTLPEGGSSSIFFVALEYAGNVEQLQESAMKLLERDATYYARMKQIEEQARKVASSPIFGEDESEEEIAAEYYHDGDNKGGEPIAEANSKPNESEEKVLGGEGSERNRNEAAAAQTKVAEVVEEVQKKETEKPRRPPIDEVI